MKRLNNQSGFTLIELVAVVAILIIITALTVPNVLKAIRQSERKIDRNNISEICDAASLFVEMKSEEYVRLNTPGGFEHISLKTLKESGYIKDQTKSLERVELIDPSRTWLKLTKKQNGEISCDLEQMIDEKPGVLKGKGTSSDPYLIESIEDLVVFLQTSNKTINAYSGNYISLRRDLDFKDNSSYVDPTTTVYGDINGDGTITTIKKELTTSTGWIPITNFTGTFDGADRIIKNLYINRTTNNTGLFQTNTKIIRNLGLKNITIIGGSNTGSLVGKNTGTIENSFIEGGTITSDSETGGLTGLTDASTGKIESSYVSNLNIKVKTNGLHAGGLTGTLSGGAQINNSYVLGGTLTIMNDGGTSTGGITGGFVGYVNNASISNSFSTISISEQVGIKPTGGFVGTITNVSSKIINSFYSGSISSSSSSVYNGLTIGTNESAAPTSIYGYQVECNGCGNNLELPVSLIDLSSPNFYQTLNWTSYEIKEGIYPRVYKSGTKILVGNQINKKIP